MTKTDAGVKLKGSLLFAAFLAGFLPVCAAAKGRPPAGEAPAAESAETVNVRALPGVEPLEAAPAAEPEPEPVSAVPSPREAVPAGSQYEHVWIWQETSDCLWNMAKEHYGDPRLWPRIYEANRHLIKDPNVIFPKQQIVIPPLEGIDRADVPEPLLVPVPVIDEPLPGVPVQPAAAPAGTKPAARDEPEKVSEEGRRDFSTW